MTTQNPHNNLPAPPTMAPTMEPRTHVTRHLVGAAVLVLLSMGTVPGCTAIDAETPPGLALRFAALNGGCQQTTNGTNTIPESIQTLVVVLKAAGVAPRIVRISRSSAAKSGSLLIKGIAITEDLNVEVYGCGAAGEVKFAGLSRGARIDTQQESTVRTFLVPVDKVACTGDAGLDSGKSAANKTGAVPESSAQLPKSTALAVAVPLASGDVVLTGGLGEWSTSARKGTATRETAIYDHRTGHFRRGPRMRAARVWHHAISLNADTVLVVGGVTQVDAIGSKSGLPTPAMVPNDIASALPADSAELLNIQPTSNGQARPSQPSTANVGVGSNLLSAALRVGEQIIFVGGVDTKGSAVLGATRLSGLSDIATGKPGKTTSVTVSVSRIRPGMVSLDDNSVIIWGGATSGKPEDMGELLRLDATKTNRLKISGDASLLKLAELATAGPAVALLSQSVKTAIFLVVGGMPFSSPLSASKAPSYIVIFDRNSGEAVLKPVTVNGKALFGGLGTTMVRGPTGQVMIAGGLVALSGAAPCDAAAAECLLSSVWRLDSATDTSAATVNFAGAAQLSLGAAQFGVAMAPVPVGVLLAGGQTVVVGKVAADHSVLTSRARVVVNLSAETSAICGK